MAGGVVGVIKFAHVAVQVVPTDNAAALHRIMDTVEMPDRMAENLLMFIRQNKGALSKKRRLEEFSKLRDDEVASIERIVRDAFEGFAEGAEFGVPP
jgi:hypothetical protein